MSQFLFISSQINGAYNDSDLINCAEHSSSQTQLMSDYWIS